MTTLLLNSVLDLLHTGRGRFNPAISQVLFVLLSCVLNAFSIALNKFVLNIYLFFSCRSRFWSVSQIFIDPRSSIPEQITTKLSSEMRADAFTDHYNCQFLLSPLHTSCVCVRMVLNLNFIACEPTESFQRIGLGHAKFAWPRRGACTRRWFLCWDFGQMWAAVDPLQQRQHGGT